MPFSTPDYRQIRAAILRDIKNQQPLAATSADSDFAIRANATAAAIEGLYQHQQWMARQILPDTADPDYLERHAALHSITRKPAANATGTLQFFGAPGSAVPAVTEASTSDGIAFVTTVPGVIGGGGSVDIAAHAVTAGLSGNQTGTLTLAAAPSGVQSQASIVSMTGGVDTESDTELLARLLYLLRRPAMGGAAHDYYSWAMSIPGVTDAYVFTQRRVINGVDVVIETAGGLPGAPLLAQVQAYIDSVRPVAADLLVMAPTLVVVDVSATLTLAPGALLVDCAATADQVLQAYFATLHVGDTVACARLVSLIMGVKGVADVILTAPPTNVVVLADAAHSELAVLGAVWVTT